MADNIHPGHTVLAIPNDARTCWVWPVDYTLNWQPAEIVAPGEAKDTWTVRFADGHTATLHRAAFMRASYHVQAHGPRGEWLMDTGIFSDMGMYADCRTMTDAEDAANHMFTDPRVASVSISQHIQETRGSSWKPGKHLKTITREDQ